MSFIFTSTNSNYITNLLYLMLINYQPLLINKQPNTTELAIIFLLCLIVCSLFLHPDNTVPRLCPFWSRNIVQSSMEPNGANIILTSLSEHFLEIIPTNNFLSSVRKKKGRDLNPLLVQLNGLIHWISGTKYAIMLNHAVSLQNFLCWFGLYLDWSFNHACWWWILNRDSAYNFWAFNMSEKRQTEYLLLISFSTCTLICPSLISDPLRNKLYNEVEGV